MLQSRYIEHEERQALFRLIKELHRQQTLQEERTYSAGVERRLAAPIPAPTRPPPPPEQRFAPAPLPSAPLPAPPPPSGPPPRLLLKEEEDELLRKKQEDDRRRREEENERRMQERQMWNASSGAAGQTKVNGILRASGTCWIVFFSYVWIVSERIGAIVVHTYFCCTRIAMKVDLQANVLTPQCVPFVQPCDATDAYSHHISSHRRGNRGDQGVRGSPIIFLPNCITSECNN